ncbi:MAG TPA: hypothetical protein VIF60_16295 [Burkholderiaceae bacterium]
MSVSSNTVTITGATITNMSYIPSSFMITEGQESSPPPTFTKDNNTWTIKIGADRKNNAAVASSFKSVTGGGSHEYAPDGGGPNGPNELNFYFGVNITVDTHIGSVIVPVYLAQGHYATTNNWWMGANGLINYGTPLLLAIGNNQVVEAFKLSGGTSSFTLTQV